MSKMTPARLLTAIVLAACLSACGGDGGNSVFVTNGVSGQVVKGIVSGARVQVYDASGTAIDRATTTTDPNGFYRIDFANPVSGPIEVRVTGTLGTLALCDAADGCEYLSSGLPLRARFGETYPMRDLIMRSVIADVPPAGAGTPRATGNVSPLTEIVSALALSNGALTTEGITDANTPMRVVLQNLLGEGTVTITPGAVMSDLTVIDLTSLGDDISGITSENLVVALFAAMTAAMVGFDETGVEAGLTQNEVFARLAADLTQDGVFNAEVQADVDASLAATKLQVRSVLLGLLQSGAFDGTAAAEVLTNLDATSLALLLSPARLPLPEAGDALGTAAISYDELTGDIAVEVTFTDVAPTRVELRLGYAGGTGNTLFALRETSDGTWIVPVGTVLDADALAALAAGRLHLFAATADKPTGALRGQLPANGIGSTEVTLTTALVLPQRSTEAAAHLFVTADERDADAPTWQFHATTDAGNVTGFRIMLGEPGTQGTFLFDLTADPELPGHWSATRSDDVLTLANARVQGQLFVEALDGDGVLLRGHLLEATDSVFPARVSRTGCTTDCDAGVAAIMLDDDRPDFINVTLDENSVGGVPHLGYFDGNDEFVPLATLARTADGHWRADLTLDGLALARLQTSQFAVRTLADDVLTGMATFGSPGPRGLTVDTTLSGAEVVGGSAIAETAELTVVAPAGAGDAHVSATVPASLTPLGVEIRVAAAGSEGEVWVVLGEDAANPGAWSASPTFTEAELDLLREGRLYAQVTTTDAADGAIRGQLIAPRFATLYLAAGTPNLTVPPSLWSGSARAAVTVTAEDRATFHFDAGNESAERVTLRRGAAGAAGTHVDSLTQDANDMQRWSLPDYTLTAELRNALAAGRLFVEAEGDGRTRAQLLPAGVTVLHGVTTGDAVVPRAPRGAAAVAALTVVGSNAEFNVTFTQVPADAAVRVGSAGRAGADLLALAPVEGTPGLWRRQQTLADETLATALESGLYIETTDPAQRAQLAAPDTRVVVAEINALQAGSDSSGRGTGAITVQPDGSFLLITRLEGLSASSVSLHAGPVGVDGDPTLALDSEGAGVWSASGVLSSAQRQLLDSGDLYLAVNAGQSLALRGQLRAATDMPPALILP